MPRPKPPQLPEERIEDLDEAKRLCDELTPQVQAYYHDADIFVARHGRTHRLVIREKFPWHHKLPSEALCHCCGELLPIDQFPRDKVTCRTCNRAMGRLSARLRRNSGAPAVILTEEGLAHHAELEQQREAEALANPEVPITDEEYEAVLARLALVPVPPKCRY